MCNFDGKRLGLKDKIIDRGHFLTKLISAVALMIVLHRLTGLLPVVVSYVAAVSGAQRRSF